MSQHQRQVDSKKKASWERFQALVLPKLQGIGWSLVLGERGTTEFEARLDHHSSIDAIRVMPTNGGHGGHLRGIALRTQESKNWRTFTIGEENEHGLPSELAKLRAARAGGGLFPFYFLQAYVCEARLLGIGVAETSALLAAVDEGSAGKRRNTAKGYDFYVIGWDDLGKNGDKLLEWNDSVDGWVLGAAADF